MALAYSFEHTCMVKIPNLCIERPWTNLPWLTERQVA